MKTTPSQPTRLTIDDLTPGVFDDRAVYVFTYGECGAFGLALHWLTGWPLFLFQGTVDEEDLSWDRRCHIMVKSPKGYADAKGFYDPTEGLDGIVFPEDGFSPVIPANLEEQRPYWRRAIPFARAFLDKHGYPDLAGTGMAGLPF